MILRRTFLLGALSVPGGLPGFLSGGMAPWWVLRGQGIPAAIDFDFQNGRYFQGGIALGAGPAQLLTVSRASTGTDLLPTSASVASYSTFGNNVARITSGNGLLIEEARTNSLLNSTTPATQTTASLNTGSYTLWVNGSGSATSSAGTATGTGFGAATNGSPNTFTLTGAGTVVVTVSGSLNAFQLEAGSFGTSLIVTAGATATRAADVLSVTTVPAFGAAYTVYTQGKPSAPTSYATNQAVFGADDGTGNNRIDLRRQASTGGFTVTDIVGGVQETVPIISGGWAAATSEKFSAAFAANDLAASATGDAATTASSPIPSAIAAISIGCKQGGNFQFNGYVERIAIWPTTRLPNSALMAITT